jgi:NAD(P)-dependent dehydrogenase (short-subunit alcohol dehydrogenase family)
MVALVTGSSRGLGKAIAARLAARGAAVALTARTMDPDPKYQGSLSQTRDEIVAAGGRAIAVQADLSQSEERARLFAEVVSSVGAPDILVNNAAVTFLRPLDGFPERRVRLMMEMHVLGPLQLSQLAIPAMRDRGRGWILNLTSVGGDLPPGPPFSDFDRTARLRHLWNGQGRAQSADQKPCRRTLRRRHRRQRRGAVQPGGHRRGRHP